MKFPTQWGVQKIIGDQSTIKECYKPCSKPTIQREGKEKPVVAVTWPEKLDEINLSTGKEKVLVGEDLSLNIEANLVEFLTTRLNAFAWEHDDITGISPHVITHKLNIDSKHAPVQQKRKRFGANHQLRSQLTLEIWG